MMIVASAKPDGMFAQAWWIFQDNIPLFWYGIKITLLLAVCGTLIGLLIGLLLGGIRAVRIEERDALPSRIIKKILHGFVGLVTGNCRYYDYFHQYRGIYGRNHPCRYPVD